MLLYALACADPPRRITLPDPARTGAPGEDGPWGAAAVARPFVARITDIVPTTIVYPSDADGALAATGLPVVVFVHGGFVGPERYEWLAAHLATRGAAVLLPSHLLDLALFQAGNASAALDGLLAESDGDGPLAGIVGDDPAAVVAGHSLGGVTAALAWGSDPRFDGLLLAAGYPAEGTDLAARADAPALALVGDADGRSPPETVAENLAPFGIPLGRVDGLNHYGWTDDATPDELASDGATDRPVAEARADALRVLDTWTDAVLAGDPEAAGRVVESDFAGVSWEAP